MGFIEGAHMHRFYRHFKGKPYRFIGTAKFSETLEEMAVYETLYENPEGKLWVRPKSMFNEIIERDGKSTPRFHLLPLVTDKIEGLPSETVVQDILKVANKVLRPLDRETLVKKILENKNSLVLTCSIGNHIVGFKSGFEQSSSIFYSWLGGVDPDYHRLGVGSALMEAMFSWCKAHGYSKIETKTTNSNKAMIVLNVISGFDIVETQVDQNGLKKILMVKNLDPQR